MKLLISSPFIFNFKHKKASPTFLETSCTQVFNLVNFLKVQKTFELNAQENNELKNILIDKKRAEKLRHKNVSFDETRHHRTIKYDEHNFHER
jgi:hypothetical protein